MRVHPVEEEKLRAYVSVVLDGCFMINDIKVVSGRDGLFISMPSRKRKNGEYRDVAHPLNQETRRRFEERILAEYQLAVGATDAPAAGPDAAAGTARLATAAAVVLLSMPADLPPNPLDELERKHSADGFWGVE